VRAAIVRIGLDGSGYDVVATGVRNGFGLAFAPDGTLFTAVNEADNQPYPFHDATGKYGQVVPDFVNENPVDQVTRVTEGLDLGWPYCMPDASSSANLVDVGYFRDPLLNPDGSALDCSTLPRVQLGLPAHSAPLGLAFTTATTLRDVLGEGALIAAHGSWDRTPPREPYVAFAPWDADTSTLGASESLVTGFQNADGSRWGRAVAAVPGPDGALYVTDDLAGLVYRIAPPLT
jgi:glucose/arabinose dehydrogenase